MDFYLNVSISSEYQQEQLLSPPSSELNGSSSSLDDLFPSQNMEEDLSLEWLSVFVEDCLTSSGNCLPPPTSVQTQKPSKTLDFQKPQTKPTSLESFTVPSKARSKRKRDVLTKRRDPLTIWSSHQTLQLTMNPDPPLLQQAHWLADSELIVPKNEEEKGVLGVSTKDKEEKVQPLGLGLMGHGLQPVARRCSHCLAHRTPQWRAGPLGPKTLCNACGVRYKSGRLLPEYRPAKSPTFVSYLHSNSHKKVMEMRNGS